MANDNSISIIKPYKYEGVWVFDDEKVNLVREAFVAGADAILDVATADIPNAEEGFVLIFSGSLFPGAQISLEWVREEMGGNVYHWADREMDGWLCPALLMYFNEAPKQLHVQVKSAG